MPQVRDAHQCKRKEKLAEKTGQNDESIILGMSAEPNCHDAKPNNLEPSHLRQRRRSLLLLFHLVDCHLPAANP
jgi:hypothetical protein